MKIAMTRKMIVLPIVLISISINTVTYAETAYIVDKLMVGMHSEKTIESAILKVIPTGTELKILNRDGDFAFVEDPEGDSGWIDNNYLMKEQPTRQLIQEAQVKSDRLEVELENAKLQIGELEEQLKQGTEVGNMQTDPKQIDALSLKNERLQQQLKEEQLNVGELHAQITELRIQIGKGNNTDSLNYQIEQLKQDKQLLEQQISDLDAIETADYSIENILTPTLEWRTLLTCLAITLIIGMIIGAYLLDYLNRRRHGGFRV
jgi:SH3 domain protein